MSAEKNIEQVPDPELDSLLDDALQDFGKPLKPQRSNLPAAGPQPTENPTNEWTEEFIQQQTKNFEATLRTIMEQQQAKSDSTPTTQEPQVEETPPSDASPQLDINAMSSEFAKFAEAAAKAASQEPNDNDFASCLANTMKQLSENNEQLKAPPSADDLSKMFESMGLGGSGDGANEMGGLFPLMQSMLENILAKDVLYPPIKEIVDKYPDWLADNIKTLDPEEFERYNVQFDVMNKIVQTFEEEKDDDSEEVKAQRFELILQNMQKLQELGQPPKDLVGDIDPIMNLDEAGNPSMGDVMSLFNSGFSAPPQSSTQDPTASSTGETAEGSEQCSIM